MKERNTEMRGLNFYNIYWLNEKNIFQHSTEGYQVHSKINITICKDQKQVEPSIRQ